MRALPTFAALLLTLGGCASQPIIVPTRPPAPPVVTPSPPPPRPMPPAPAPAPAPLAADWRDWPFTAGSWGYEGGNAPKATFAGVDGAPLLVLRCHMGARQMELARPGAASGAAQMTIRTDDATLLWPANSGSATRAATDSGLDRIVYSRGRFTVELPGMTPLVLRPWSEVSRAIEECRGN